MKDIAVLVKQILEDHTEDQDICDHSEWPCPEYRIASDWTRQRKDLRKTWRNKSFVEVYYNRKLFCCMCSKAETGLVCDDCVSEADEAIA